MYAMSRLMHFLHLVVYVIGIAACGSVRSPGSDDGGVIDGGVVDDGKISTPPSCMTLPATCGASGNDSCCNSPDVPGGTYYRSYDLAGDANSGNTNYPATVSSFRLDKYEVTVGRFRAFVNSGMGTQSNPPLTLTGA